MAQLEEPRKAPVSFIAKMPLIRARAGDTIIAKSGPDEKVVAFMHVKTDAEFVSRESGGYELGGGKLTYTIGDGSEIYELKFERAQVADIRINFPDGRAPE